MDALLIDTAIAGAGLVIGSGLTAAVLRRHRDLPLTSSSVDIPLADMDPLINDAAQRWAAHEGRPEFAGLAADKLRTLYAIKYDRPPRSQRRWFRW
jgi:hypothetical protein